MPNFFSRKVVKAGVLLVALFAGCASVPKTTKVTLKPSANATAIASIRSWMDNQSRELQSLAGTGDITVEQNGESNSASFSMKSKRLTQVGEDAPVRVDSLSIEVTGPLGIKVARFMASPTKYEFYDILHDQTLSGRTDQESLEELTHLSGISLQDMSDLIYGLVRIDSSADDSVELYSDNADHSILVVREPGIRTSAYDFQGEVGSPSSEHLSLVRYRRWMGTPDNLDTPPALTVQFMEPGTIANVSLPQRIEATAGANTLILHYNHLQLNPASLVVRIKMPQ